MPNNNFHTLPPCPQSENFRFELKGDDWTVHIRPGVRFATPYDYHLKGEYHNPNARSHVEIAGLGNNVNNITYQDRSHYKADFRVEYKNQVLRIFSRSLNIQHRYAYNDYTQWFLKRKNTTINIYREIKYSTGKVARIEPVLSFLSLEESEWLLNLLKACPKPQKAEQEKYLEKPYDYQEKASKTSILQKKDKAEAEDKPQPKPIEAYPHCPSCETELDSSHVESLRCFVCGKLFSHDLIEELKETPPAHLSVEETVPLISDDLKLKVNAGGWQITLRKNEDFVFLAMNFLLFVILALLFLLIYNNTRSLPVLVLGGLVVIVLFSYQNKQRPYKGRYKILFEGGKMYVKQKLKLFQKAEKVEIYSIEADFLFYAETPNGYEVRTVSPDTKKTQTLIQGLVFSEARWLTLFLKKSLSAYNIGAAKH